MPADNLHKPDTVSFEHSWAEFVKKYILHSLAQHVGFEKLPCSRLLCKLNFSSCKNKVQAFTTVTQIENRLLKEHRNRELMLL